MTISWQKALNVLGIDFGTAHAPAVPERPPVPLSDTLTGAKIMGGLVHTPMFQALPLETRSEFRRHFVAMLNERARRGDSAAFTRVDYTFAIATSLDIALARTTKERIDIPEGALPLVNELNRVIPTISESDLYGAATRFAAGLTLVADSPVRSH